VVTFFSLRARFDLPLKIVYAIPVQVNYKLQCAKCIAMYSESHYVKYEFETAVKTVSPTIDFRSFFSKRFWYSDKEN